MLKKYIYRALLCSAFLAPLKGSSQFFGGNISGLGKIKIKFLNEPNRKPATILDLAVDYIKNAGSLSVFGTPSNNGMTRSAELMDAMYKIALFPVEKSISKSARTDTRFQECIAGAAGLSDRDITVFFVNDVSGVTEENLKEYSFYYKSILISDFKFNYIWPGVFQQLSGPVIVIGESYLKNLSLTEAKKVLLNLVVCAAMGEYGPMKSSLSIHDFNTGKDMTRIVFAQSDRRKIEFQAIANAIMLYYSPRFREDAYEWITGASYFYLPKSEAKLVTASDEGAPLPLQRHSLRDRFLAISSANTGTAYEKTGSPFLDQFLENLVYYSVWDLKSGAATAGHYYFFQSDLSLGVFFYIFIRAYGLDKFLECIRYDNFKLKGVKPQLRTLFLVQNICLNMMGDKDLQYLKDNPGSKEAKNVIFPLAILSQLGTGFKTNNLADYKKTLMAATDAAEFRNRGVFDELVQYYFTVHHKKISDAFIANTPMDNENGFIFNKSARIARIIGID